MPVTFNTDLRDLKDFGYVQQVPLEAMFKNLGYKQAQFDQNANQLQSQVNSLVVDAYGQDVEVRDAFLKNLNTELATFAGKNVGDSSVANQISGYVSKASKDPALVASQSRAMSYDKMMKDKREAELKGKVWINDGLTAAQNYYNSGKFDVDTRFSDQGFEAPDDEYFEKIATATPEYQKWVTNGGYDDEFKGKTVESLYNNYLTAFQTSPKLARYYDHLYKNSEAAKSVDSFAGDNVKILTSLIPNLPQAYQVEALNHINNMKRMDGSPAGKAAIKSFVKNLWYQNQAYEAAEAKRYVHQTGHKINDYSKMATEFDYAIKLSAINAQEAKDLVTHTAWVNSGGQLDDKGLPIIYPEEKRDGIVNSTKYSVTKPGGKTETVSLDPNLATYYKITSGKEKLISSFVAKDKDGVKQNDVDLSKYNLGKGWVQISDPNWLMPILERYSTTQDGVTVTSKNLAYVDGLPLIYVKNGVISYGLKNDTRSAVEMRTIPNKASLVAGLANSSGYKSAKTREMLAASDAAGNIFQSNDVTEVKPSSTTPDVKTAQQPEYKTKKDFIKEAKSRAKEWTPIQQQWADSVATKLNLK